MVVPVAHSSRGIVRACVCRGGAGLPRDRYFDRVSALYLYALYNDTCAVVFALVRAQTIDPSRASFIQIETVDRKGSPPALPLGDCLFR